MTRDGEQFVIEAIWKPLKNTIGVFIDGWNERCQPFTWTKDPDELLTKIKRAKTKTSGLTDH